MFASSCSTPLQEITYMYGVSDGDVFQKVPFPETYHIRPNDQLFIQVIGDDPMNTAFLNLTPTDRMMTNISMELITYIVNEDGEIAYPQLGDLHVAGKTLSEVRNMLQEEISKYLDNTSVFVKLVNRSITVLGEVRQPGLQTMTKNQLTIFEALGTAGDITDFGNRKNVKLIRETKAGKQVVEIDLTNPSFISSEHYYVLPHDVIYVEPARKVYGAKTLPYSSQFSMVMTVISTALLILNILK